MRRGVRRFSVDFEVTGRPFDRVLRKRRVRTRNEQMSTKQRGGSKSHTNRRTITAQTTTVGLEAYREDASAATYGFRSHARQRDGGGGGGCRFVGGAFEGYTTTLLV